MSRFRLSCQLLVATGVCALLLGVATVHAQQYDDSQPSDSSQAYDNSDQAPGRVARLASLSGQVQFAPAGESDWGSVEVNRPMVIGDRLLTGEDGRAVLELGDASVRIDNDSAFDFLNLDQDNVQIELSQGTLNLAVRQLAQGANFEVDTPTVAFVAAQPGIYRIDDDPSGTGSMVTVFQGAGTVYGENGVSRQVAAGTSYRFNDSSLANVTANGLPQPDDFDRFCEARDANYNRYAQQQQQYVPPDMIGGDDLDQYGQWNDVPEYGNVWYPQVPAGWAPYRDGHWVWIDPWGWTWVDNQPWGFAPFHYGRWAYIGNRWGWMPGQVHVRPVYAPALVAFIGGSGLSLSVGLGGGGPVGWFPLGPRDVYVPWFRASRNYFTNVNVTNIRNVYVNKTVINNYYGDYRTGRVPPRGGHDYAYRRMPGAVTAVPRNVFTGARPVHPAALKLDRTRLARTEVALRPGVNPDRSSLGLRHPTVRPATIKGHEPFVRPVVARHQPPPRPVDFAARQKAIASQHGQPLTARQMQDLRKAQPAPRENRVKLVSGAAAGAAAIGALHRATPPRPAEPVARTQPTRPVVAPRAGEPPARRAGSTAPFKNTVHPIQAPVNPVRNAPQRPNELPSARFAHPHEPATLPRAPVISPAGEPQRNAPASNRLPVVRPVERAPRQVDNRAAQQQRQAEIDSQQRARAQQLQQQRQAQTQAQQRARDQQAQQQRQAQMQEQRVREQQTQRQRQAEVQSQQRAREQQMQQQQQIQQQRNMQMQRQQQVQQREIHRAPQQRNNPPSQRREPPPRKRPPPSSDHPIR